MEIFETIAEHLYEILIGVGVIVSTIINKPKSTEKLLKIKEKRLTKVKTQLQKDAQKTAKEAAEIEKLEKEIKNASGS